MISWRLTRHGGGEAAQLLQEAEVRSSLAEEGGGWRTVSVAAVRLPRGEATAGLHLECVAENPRTGATLAQAKTISIHCESHDIAARLISQNNLFLVETEIQSHDGPKPC